jgi:hypothetical protein
MATARKRTYQARPAAAPFQIDAFDAEGDAEALVHGEAFAEPIAVAQAKALSRDHGYVEVRRAGLAHPVYRFCDGALTL